jgi:hypothetical protein
VIDGGDLSKVLVDYLESPLARLFLLDPSAALRMTAGNGWCLLAIVIDLSLELDCPSLAIRAFVVCLRCGDGGCFVRPGGLTPCKSGG